ncbi:MAG: polysaccharide biosynthesis tyrosine autokinase [Rhodospirillaceae bacterium]
MDMPREAGGLSDTLAKLWRRKWLIAGTTLGAVVLAGIVAVSLTPRYDAEAKLRIGLPESQLTEASSGFAKSGTDAALVQSEQYILTSREVAGRVVDRLALKQVPEFNPRLQEPGPLDRFSPTRLLRSLMPSRPPPATSGSGTGSSGSAQPPVDRERELAIGSVLGRVSVEPLGRSHVISIGARSEDPELAARIANTLGEIYLEEKAVQRTDAIGSANTWLSRHIQDLRTQLEDSERAVEEYRREHSLYSSRSDTLTSQQLGELNSQVITAQAQLAEAQTRLRQATETMKAANPGGAMSEVLQSPLIQALKQQESAVERRAAELSTKYGSKHPAMQDVQAEKTDIARRIRSEINNIIGGLRNEAAAANARYQALKSNLDATKDTMGETNTVSIKLNALEREAEANRALFQQFLQRVKETEVQRDMELVNSRIISFAAIPGSPSFPPLNLLMAVALIGGILVGVLLVLLIEQMDDTFRTDDDIESQTALPMLAVVPKVSRRKLRDDYILRHPTSELSESVRRIAMSLRLDENRERGKVVMMTSSVANEGKSGICLGLAKITAATGANVIVLDCDWRRPQLHTMVGRPNHIGIGDLLTGNTRPEDVVYRDSSGAHMIFAGKLRARHANLIFSERMRYLLQSLSKHYDLVLVDTPPVLVGAEVMHLSRLVDMAVYVVRWGRTKRDVALKGLRHLSTMDAPLVGTVLSQVHTSRYRRYVGHSGAYGYSTAALGRTG